MASHRALRPTLKSGATTTAPPRPSPPVILYEHLLYPTLKPLSMVEAFSPGVEKAFFEYKFRVDLLVSCAKRHCTQTPDCLDLKNLHKRSPAPELNASNVIC